MAIMKKPVKKMQTGGSSKPTYKNLGLARTATNNAAGRDTNTPATKNDSLSYKKGFEMGKSGKKPSALQLKYEGKNQYEEKGRWEGQNSAKKKPVNKAKSGGKMKKAQGGTSFAKLAPPYDKATFADKIAGAKKNAGKAKSGTSVKKTMKSGGKMKTCKGGC